MGCQLNHSKVGVDRDIIYLIGLDDSSHVVICWYCYWMAIINEATIISENIDTGLVVSTLVYSTIVWSGSWYP